MDREPGEEILFRGHPSWLSLGPFVVRGLLVSLVLGIAAGIASALAVGRVQTAWVATVVIVACAVRLARGQARRLRVTYSITTRRLAIETGLLSRRRHEARLDRVLDVHARQSLLERALGIGSVHVETAGELPSLLCFRGVDDPRRVARAVDRAVHRREDGWEAYVAELRL